MRCYLCENTKNLSKYVVDEIHTVFVCKDCEDELLIDNCIELEDRICEKPHFGEDDNALSVCA